MNESRKLVRLSLLSSTEPPFPWYLPSSLPSSHSSCGANAPVQTRAKLALSKELKQKGKGHDYGNHSPAGDSPRPHRLAFPAGDPRSIEGEGQIQGHVAAGALAYL